ncbi:MAG TPA: hypothetical protein VE953_19155 [Terriglobales bacterium]|nr:hypothetical protein [Terriglobales bacterium]
MPWPFGFAQALEGLGTRFGRSRSETASPEAPPPPRATGRDWVDLPPIQRATGDLPLTASSRAFASGLPGAVGVPLALQPLGHARSPDAPAGLVTGLASPAPTYAGGERLVYVQRRPAGQPGLLWPAWRDEPAGEPVEAAAVEMPALPPAIAPRAVPAVAAVLPPASLTVSPPEIALPATPLVVSRAEGPSQAAPTAALDVPSGVGVDSAAEPAPSRRLNVGQSRRIGLGAPLAPAAGRAAVQRSADVPGLPEPSEASAGEEEDIGPPVQRMEAGPPAPVAPRATAAPPDLPAELSRPIFRVQRRSAGAPPAGARAHATPPASGPEPPPPAGPDAAPVSVADDPAPPAQRATAPSSLPPAPGGPADPAAQLPVVPVQRIEAGSEPMVSPSAELPVVPARPLDSGSRADDAPPLPLVPIQRVEAEPLDVADAGAGPDPSEVEGEPDVADLAVVPAQRLEAGSSPSHQADPAAFVAGALPVVPLHSVDVSRPRAGHAAPSPTATLARAVFGGGPAGPATAPAFASLPLVGERPLPVSAGAPVSPAGSPAGLPTAADPAMPLLGYTEHEPTAVWPVPTATEAANAALAPVARMARPVVQPMPETQPAAVPLDLPYLPAAGSRTSGEPPVQRAPEGQQYLAIEVPVQRAEAASSAASASSASGPAAGGAEDGSPKHSEKELDELARQLYERLRSRLRMELLVDRERAGLITDLR